MSNTFARMEDLAPKPLRIIKRARVQQLEPSGISGISFLPIPRRQSSLQTHSRQSSGGSGTSTETPPIEDDPERLVLPKHRASDMGRLEGGVRDGTNIDNPIDLAEVCPSDPFIQRADF